MDEQFNFSKALAFLKTGRMICRKNWNGKGMFIFLFNQEGVIIKHPYNDDIPKEGEIFGYDAKSFIMMKTSDNQCIPWVASQTDLLADDWSIFFN